MTNFDGTDVMERFMQRKNELEEHYKAEAEKFVASLPAPVQQRVGTLKDLQTKRNSLEAEFKKELEALEEKYRQLYAPLYEQRKGIIAPGAGVPDEKDGVPKFWSTALFNMPMVRDQITTKDLEVLEYLTDVTCDKLPTDSGFSITFHFADNPFFTNKTLTIQYVISYDMPHEEPVLQKIVGAEINWRPGKDVTVKTMKKQPKKPGQRVLVKTLPADSFFHLFNPPELPEEEDFDEQALDDLQEDLESNFDIGMALRMLLVPNALLWYTGEALGAHMFMDDEDEDEDYEDDEDDYDDEDDDEDDEDDDDDDDDDDEAQPRAPGAGRGAVRGVLGGVRPVDTHQFLQGGPQDPNAPECKQQ